MKSIPARILVGAIVGHFLTAAAFGQTAITIDSAHKHQTVEGFGTALAWWVTSPYDQDAWRNMYYQDLGASMLRMDVNPFVLAPGGNLDAAPVHLGANIQDNIALMDFHVLSVTNFGEMAAAGTVKTLDDFKLIGSIWTPPHWMKTTSGPDSSYFSYINTGNGNSCGGHLKVDADNLEQFGRYVAAYVKGMEQTYGVPLYALSLQNELRFAQPYNSCVYTPAEYVAAVKAVGAEFERQGIMTHLIGPEDVGVDGGWLTQQQMSFVNAIESDPDASRYLWGYAVHGYTQNGVDPAANRNQMADYYNQIQPYGKPTWQTETSGFEPGWQSGAIWIARAIHEGLVYGNYNAWLYWQTDIGVSWPSNEALTTGTDTASKKYNAAKHYFRYIRPGAVRIDAGPDDVDAINVSAFVHEEQKTVTIVLLNIASNAQSAEITLPWRLDVTSFENYRTSDTESFASLAAVESADGLLTLEIPAKSLVTLYGSFSGSRHDWLTATADGDWTNPSNWDASGTPATEWVARLRNDTPIARDVVLASDSTLHSLLIQGPGAVMTLHVQENITLTTVGGIRLTSGGVLQMQGGRIEGGAITLQGGRVGGAGVLAASFNVDSGQLDASDASHDLILDGPVAISAGVTLLKTGPGTLVLKGTQSHQPGSALTVQAGLVWMATDGGPNLAVNANGGGVTFAVSQNLRDLSLSSEGVATLEAGTNTLLVVTALSIDNSGGVFHGTLDLKDNNLAIRAPAGTGQTVWTSDILPGVLTGFNNGAFGNKGLTSSTAPGAGNTALAAIINDDGFGNVLFGSGADIGAGSGQTEFDSLGALTIDDILIKYTYYGDLDLSGQVDGLDQALMDIFFGSVAGGWLFGDIDYNGFTDGLDQALLDIFFGNGTGGGFGDPLSTGGSGNTPASVPEPGTAMLFLFGISAWSQRQRRRHDV